MQVELTVKLSLTIEEARMGEIALSGVKSINEAAEAMAQAIVSQNGAIKQAEYQVVETRHGGTVKAGNGHGTTRGGKRSDGGVPMAEAILEVMPVGREMSVREVSEALWGSGYRNPSNNKKKLHNSVSATFGNPSWEGRKQVKRLARGRYVRTK